MQDGPPGLRLQPLSEQDGRKEPGAKCQQFSNTRNSADSCPELERNST